MSRAEQLRRWLPVVAWGGVISLFSTRYFTGESTGKIILPILGTLFPSATHAELVAMHYFIRKLGHFTEYLILSVLLYRALRAGHRWSFRAAAGQGLLAVLGRVLRT